MPTQSDESEAARLSREALAAAMRGWKPFRIVSKDTGQEIGHWLDRFLSRLWRPGRGGIGVPGLRRETGNTRG